MGSPLLNDPSLGIEVRKIPSVNIMSGSKLGDKTPLDQFYHFACNLGSVEGVVHIDAAKIAMNSEDAKTLYILLRAYLTDKYGDREGAEIAAKAWHHFGPHVRRDVPRGYVFIAPGLFIMPTKVDKSDVPKKQLMH